MALTRSPIGGRIAAQERALSRCACGSTVDGSSTYPVRSSSPAVAAPGVPVLAGRTHLRDHTIGQVDVDLGAVGQVRVRSADTGSGSVIVPPSLSTRTGLR